MRSSRNTWKYCIWRREKSITHSRIIHALITYEMSHVKISRRFNDISKIQWRSTLRLSSQRLNIMIDVSSTISSWGKKKMILFRKLRNRKKYVRHLRICEDTYIVSADHQSRVVATKEHNRKRVILYRIPCRNHFTKRNRRRIHFFKYNNTVSLKRQISSHIVLW